jgi:hypothetical protein
MSPQLSPNEDLFGAKTDEQKRADLAKEFIVFLRTVQDAPMNMWDLNEIVENLTRISSAIKKEEVVDPICIDLFKHILGRYENYLQNEEIYQRWLLKVNKESNIYFNHMDAFDYFRKTYSSSFMNNRHVILKEIPEEKVKYVAQKDFIEFNQNIRIITTVDGKVRNLEASREWLKSSYIRKFESVVCIPREIYYPYQTDSEVFNLWRGFAVKPKKGKSCVKTLAYINDILCNGDVERYNLVEKWIAFGFQHPDRLPETALVFSGLEGVGKSFIAKIICRLIGKIHSWNTDNAETVFGRFNTPLAGCLFLCLDETGSARHHTYTKKLMSLITKDTVQIEEKFGAIAMMNNSCSVMIMGNDSWLVQASPESRRWNCLSVSDAKIQDDEYFGEIWKELDEDEGWEALMYYFKYEVDLSAFNPRKILVTRELRHHRDKSLRGVTAIWNAILERGELIEYKIFDEIIDFRKVGEFYDVSVDRINEMIND